MDKRRGKGEERNQKTSKLEVKQKGSMEFKKKSIDVVLNKLATYAHL